MAATFTTTGDWFGKIEAKFETATKVAGKAEPKDGHIWRRKMFTITRSRAGQGLTAFTPNVGGTAVGSVLSIVNGSDTITGNASDTYMLLQDDVVPTPQGSGMWEEQQVAVSFGEWEQWEIGI